MVRSIIEVKERLERLKQNFDIIKNEQGKSNITIMMNTLEEYINNPSLDLDYLIDNSTGQRKQTLKWIARIAE